MTAHGAAAVLYNGLARYEEALSAARQATSNPFEPLVSVFALPELVEAAARAGHTEAVARIVRDGRDQARHLRLSPAMGPFGVPNLTEPTK